MSRYEKGNMISRLCKPIKLIALLAIFLSACGSSSEPAPSAVPPTESTVLEEPIEESGAFAFSLPEGEGECTLTASGQSSIYYRPHVDADIFGDVGQGFEATVSGISNEEWVGFSPGVAQAANIGPFRLRWINYEEISLSGDCTGVPEMWAAPPGVCFTMPMGEVTIYAAPVEGTYVLAEIDIGDFAAVSGYADENWAQVDLEQGNTGLSGVGWISRQELNLNGPCEDLPLINSE